MYKPVMNCLWKTLTTAWDLNEALLEITGKTIKYYKIEEEGERTSWVDKYLTTIFNLKFDKQDKTIFCMQPIPDCVRWLTTGGEMHYLPMEKICALNTHVVNETSGAYLPSKLFDMVFRVFRHGIEGILHCIAFLCWCREQEVKRFLDESREKLDKSFQDEKEKEYSRQDVLYKTNEKA